MQLYLERNFADKHSTTLPCWLRLELTFAPFNTHYGSQISESCGIKVVREGREAVPGSVATGSTDDGIVHQRHSRWIHQRAPN